jgi:hypothetical protein
MDGGRRWSPGFDHGDVDRELIAASHELPGSVERVNENESAFRRQGRTRMAGFLRHDLKVRETGLQCRGDDGFSSQIGLRHRRRFRLLPDRAATLRDVGNWNVSRDGEVDEQHAKPVPVTALCV